MSDRQKLLWAVAASLALVGCQAAPSVPDAHLVIRGATVLSPEEGTVARGRTVWVAGDEIIAIVSDEEPAIPEGARVIDAVGLYLMPGMWDLHTHLTFADDNAGPLMVTQGVTGARDMGAVLADIETIRDRIERGETLGPRIVRAGPALNGAEFGEHQRLIDSPAAARAAVLELDSAGVDIIKTHNATERDTYFALLNAADEAGLQLVGHVPIAVSPLEACERGHASIDHIATIFEGVYLERFESEMDAFQSMDTWLVEDAPDLTECFASQGTLFVPTLYPYHFRANRGAFYDDPPEGWEYLTEASRETYRTEMVPSARDRNAEVIAFRSSLVEVGKVFTRMVFEAGGAVGTGTDFAGPGVVPGFGVHHEVQLLADAGLPPHAAVWAATRGPGLGAGAEPLTGRIEVGAPADLVLLRENPFEDVGALSTVEGVGLRGRWLDRGELEAILASLARN